MQLEKAKRLNLLAQITLLACAFLLFPQFAAAALDDHHLGADALLAEAARLAPAAQNQAATLVAPAERVSLGQWSEVIPWTPHIPVSAALLADGRLLTFASNQRTTFPDGPQFTYAAVWDPATGTFAEINNPRHDMFCGGLALLQDGRLLVNGGNGIMGTTALSSLFDWRTNQWSAAQAMPEGRWYNTSLALPNGEVLTAGGNGGGNGAGTMDQWRAATGWRRMSGIPWAGVVKGPVPNSNEPNWHPFLLLAPDGRVAHFGPHHDLNWITTAGTGSLAPAGASLPGSHYPKQAAWAMYDVGRVVVAGGLQAIDNTTVVADSFTVDLNGSTPVVAPAAPMAHARAFANSVILPNGEVMVVGGTTVGTFGSDAGTIYTPEIWNPTTRQWRTAADLSIPRNYHSLALLLPDGRVWSGGGGLYGDSNVDHQDAQVYTPGPLFQADGTLAPRPQITAVPDRIGPGAVFSVSATPGVQYFSFIRMSSLTHSVNTDQRHLRLPHTVKAPGQYVLSAPGSVNVLAPGYWMLFAVDANGVWSVSRIVQVTNASAPVVTNPGDQEVVQGAAATLQVEASAAGPLSYSASGLPAGLSIHPSTGLISGGIAAAAGTWRSTIYVTCAGQTASVSFSWVVSAATLGSGQIRREWWTNIEGATLVELTTSSSYPGTPDGADLLPNFETPENWGDNTGQRVRGFLRVPVTGQYRFFISSDDQSMLLLSTDSNPANAVQIASLLQWTPSHTWTWYPDQASTLITLNAGTSYYIEAVMKEGLSDDHLAVGWQKPGDSEVSVIPGACLLPYLPAQQPAILWHFDEPVWNGAEGEIKPAEQSAYLYAGTAYGARTSDLNPALTGYPGTGRSAAFGGAERAVVPYNAVFNPRDLTVSAWVRLEGDAGTERCILSSRESTSGGERGYGLWIGNDGRWQFRTGGAAAVLAGPLAVSGQWTHIAATFDTTNAAKRTGVRKLYVNGVLAAQDTAVYQLNASQPLVFGAAASAGGSFFAGALDEVSLHHSPLSAADILAVQTLRHATDNQPQPQLANPGAQASVAGAVVSLPVWASDPENDPLTFSATGLPPGLAMEPKAGVIFGTVTGPGIYHVTVTATDGVTPAAAVSFSWTVTAGLKLQSMAAGPLAGGAVQTYAATALNGLNPRYKWNFGDGMPETEWSSSPAVSHTFASPGRYLVTITATDDTGMEASTSFYQAVHAPLTARKPNISSGIAYQDLATANDRVWAVNPDNNSVAAFDVVTRVRHAEITVGAAPRALAFAPDGRLWVVNVESASISMIDTNMRSVRNVASLPRGSRPHGLVFDPAGACAWVALEGAGRVLKLNPTSGALVASVDAGGPVRHLSISADGTRLYASRYITPRVAGEETAAPVLAGSGGQVVVINTAALAVERTILLNPSTAADTETSARGLPNYLGAAAISPDGLSAWVPSKQDNIQRGMLRDGQPLNHETTVRAIVSRIDLVAQAEHQPSRVDIDNAGMPAAAAYDPWGVYLFVALEASRDVAILDAWTHQEILRFPVGRAPQGLAFSPDGRMLYVQNYMDRTVSAHDVSSIVNGGAAMPSTLAILSTVTTEALPAQVLLGKKLFHDAKDTRLAKQDYMSCASCHNDGGHDGRVWDMTGFGEGLRNTITLKGHGNHGPMHWSGNFDEVQDFEGQIRTFAGGSGLITSGTPNAPMDAPNAGRSADLDALAAYVKSLTTHGTSPARTATGELTAAAAEGQQIFRMQNCASCHGGASFTNSAAGVFADIGTLKPSSGKRLGGALTGLDVPTLRGVWATAPYLHDGSAATLEDAIKAHRGLTLSEAETARLAAFVASIDDAPAAAPQPFALVLNAPETTVAGAFTVTAIFNSAAAGFELGDVVVANGTKSNFSGSGAVYSFTVTPSASGKVTVSVPAGMATDSTGLGNLASNVLSVAYDPGDTVPPTVALSTPSATVSSSFVVTAMFSESVTGLQPGEFTVANGSVTALSAAGAVWSATITPAGAGAVTVALPANAAQDAAGNGNTASNILSITFTPPAAATGITADYYSGKNFGQKVLSRVDANIDFVWDGAPAAGVPEDGFSVRWEGQIVPAATGTFDFITRSDDGVRLWLNGALVIDNWTDHGEMWDTATLNLQAGVPLTVKMEFYENTGGAMARLFWDGPGAAFVPVPASAFRPLQGAASGITARNSLAVLGSSTPLQGNPALAPASAEAGLQIINRGHAALDAVLVRTAGQGTLALETTTDLVKWSRIAIMPVVSSLGGGMERVTWPDLQKVSGLSLARGIVRARTLQSWGGSVIGQPVGWQQVVSRSGVQSCGINLCHPPVFTGAVSAASATGVVLAGQAALAASIDPARAFYLEIVGGPAAGHRLDVAAITATACEIAADSATTTLAPAAVDWAAATVCLRPHVTLADVFDPARFQASSEAASADQVLFHNGTGYDTCWLFDDGVQRRWLLNGDTTYADMGGTVIPPGTGVMLQIAATTPLPVVFTGIVRTTPFARVIPASGGYALLANPWPVNATPASAGMTGPAFTAGAQPTAADQIQLWASDANAAATGYTGYWLSQNSTQPAWIPTSAGANAPQNDASLLSAGRATFLKTQAQANRAVWIIPAR